MRHVTFVAHETAKPQPFVEDLACECQHRLTRFYASPVLANIDVHQDAATAALLAGCSCQCFDRPRIIHDCDDFSPARQFDETPELAAPGNFTRDEYFFDPVRNQGFRLGEG